MSIDTAIFVVLLLMLIYWVGRDIIILVVDRKRRITLTPEQFKMVAERENAIVHTKHIAYHGEIGPSFWRMTMSVGGRALVTKAPDCIEFAANVVVTGHAGPGVKRSSGTKSAS